MFTDRALLPSTEADRTGVSSHTMPTCPNGGSGRTIPAKSIPTDKTRAEIPVPLATALPKSVHWPPTPQTPTEEVLELLRSLFPSELRKGDCSYGEYSRERETQASWQSVNTFPFQLGKAVK